MILKNKIEILFNLGKIDDKDFVTNCYLQKIELPKTVTGKFYTDETEMKQVVKLYDEGILANAEVYNQIIDILIKYREEL